MDRVVLHVDMDAFYASVEARDDPALRGRPLVVGADPGGGAGRGVVCTASYEARAFGIRSAMPISQAYRLAPHATYVRPDFQRYGAASRAVTDVLRRGRCAPSAAGARAAATRRPSRTTRPTRGASGRWPPASWRSSWGSRRGGTAGRSPP